MFARKFFLASILSLLFWSTDALAHDLWLEPEDGAFLLRYGHRGHEALPLEANKLQSLMCRKDSGAAQNLVKSAVAAPRQISLKASCTLLSAFFDGGFWSLTPDGEKNLPKNKVPDAVKSWRSKQFAKWVDSHSPLANQPLGDEFEIVPVTDLAKAKTGGKATFRILLAGKPLSGATLAIDHKPLAETDDQGEARISIRGHGRESVSVSYRRKVKAAEADSEVWEASLTFEVAQ
jgi:uncharacterized GH25 family protein